MVVFPAMISSLVSSGIISSYSSGVVLVLCATVRFDSPKQTASSLCSHVYRQCCLFAVRVQDLLHVKEVYVMFKAVTSCGTHKIDQQETDS